MKAVPIHQLLTPAPVKWISRYFQPGDLPEVHELQGVHRDDHYIFFLIEDGEAQLQIDFETKTLHKWSVYYILPGQIHHRIENRQAKGWFLGVDTELLREAFRDVFEGSLLTQHPKVLNQEEYEEISSLARLLTQRKDRQAVNLLHDSVTSSLLQAFIGSIAGKYVADTEFSTVANRSRHITRDFKRLLAKKFRVEKKPSAYAAALNITVNYLNESIKKETGYPVSYWIIRENLVEAKRLLFFGDQSVKEIAYHLGYDNPDYFLRLFRKYNGETPTAFRQGKR